MPNVGDRYIITSGRFMNSFYRKYQGRYIEITKLVPMMYGTSMYAAEYQIRWRTEGTKEGDNGFDDSIESTYWQRFAEDVGLVLYPNEPTWEV